MTKARRRPMRLREPLWTCADRSHVVMGWDTGATEHHGILAGAESIVPSEKRCLSSALPALRTLVCWLPYPKYAQTCAH
jgi:hypothetical protein